MTRIITFLFWFSFLSQTCYSQPETVWKGSSPTDIAGMGMALFDKIIQVPQQKGVAITIVNQTQNTWQLVNNYSEVRGMRNVAWEEPTTDLIAPNGANHEDKGYYSVSAMRCHTYVMEIATHYWDLYSVLVYFSKELDVYLYIYISNSKVIGHNAQYIKEHYYGVKNGIIAGIGIGGKSWFERVSGDQETPTKDDQYLRRHICLEAAKSNEHCVVSTSQVATAKYGKLNVRVIAGDNCLITIMD